MNIFSFIKSRVSILNVASEYTTLKKAGLYWKATCPFHSEKDASFTVSPHKEIFYCFGCHAGGDVISFIEKIEQCSPLEAARFLADRYHIEISEKVEWTKDSSSFKEKEHYFKVCSAVAQWVHNSLFKSHDALDYLTKRCINKISIDDYMLGYFPGGQRGINSLLQTLKRQNIMPNDLIEARIIIENKGYIYSPFEERIIFPICDYLGRYCGFGGRIFKAADERAKYYNSHENSYFQKGKLVFGLNIGKNVIQKAGEVFLVEGYTDCIAMRQHGFANTVSTLGTACTTDHLQILARYCDRIIILYDGDDAGQRAIMRLTGLCWQVSLELSVISLPQGDDPASFLARGGDLKELVAKSQDIFEFFLESVGKDFQAKSLAEKVTKTYKILGIIGDINSSLKRTILLQKAAAVFSIPYEVLCEEMQLLQKNSGFNRSSVEGTSLFLREGAGQKSLSKEISRLEKKFFFAIMSNIQLFNCDSEGYLIGYFSEPLRSILEKLQLSKTQDPTLGFNHFFDGLGKDEQRVVSEVLLESDAGIEGGDFEHLLDQFRRRSWKRLVHAVKVKMGFNSTKFDENTKLLNDLIELRKRIFNKDDQFTD